MAERVGFEPTCPLLAGKTLSRRPRYDRFGTSPTKTGVRDTGYETRESKTPGHGKRGTGIEFSFAVSRIVVLSAVTRIPYPVSRILPLLPEKLLNDRSAIGSQDTSCHLDLVIQLAVIQNTER